MGWRQQSRQPFLSRLVIEREETFDTQMIAVQHPFIHFRPILIGFVNALLSRPLQDPRFEFTNS
jgi:hypothetical protein